MSRATGATQAPSSVVPAFPSVRRSTLEALQVNLGYRCNQACTHCHVDAGPNRTELMSLDIIELALEFLDKQRIKTLDITGGAPELNPHFATLVSRARSLNVEVMDRCNLTVLEEPGQETLGEFLAAEKVHIVASLPCHSVDNVDAQRGLGVFDKSIRALQRLNALGYGQRASGLVIDLVFNPQGTALPPPQGALERDYKRILFEEYGIEFNRLLTITNMPIARFRHALARDGKLDGYFDTLLESFQVANLNQLMCKQLLSVDWRGYVYDCDFNQMLSMPVGGSATPVHLSSLLNDEFLDNNIAVADHCYGCTAGQGSSCGGALSG